MFALEIFITIDIVVIVIIIIYKIMSFRNVLYSRVEKQKQAKWTRSKSKTKLIKLILVNFSIFYFLYHFDSFMTTISYLYASRLYKY